MENKHESVKRIYNYVANFFLMLVSVAVFRYIWITELNPLMRTPFEGKGNILLFIVYVVILFLMISLFQGVKIGYYRLSNLLISRSVAYICAHIVLGLQIILMIGQVKYSGIIVMRVIEVLAITGTLNAILTIIITKIYNKIIPPYQMIIINGDYQNNLRKKIDYRSDKYKVKEEIHISEDMDKIKEKILLYDAVMLNDIPTDKKNMILKFCFENDIRTYFVPKISDILVKGAAELKIFDTPVFLCRNMQLTFEQRFAKRTMDIIISLILLILSSPIMLLTWIAIKMEDGGSAFYMQERCTMNEKRFNVYKFRSMRMDAEKNGAQLAKANDSRITNVGAFIRKTRIDELPQLINILKGEMSFVGPRPERPEFVKKNCESIPEFKYRMKVKAGLTGYAQVYGKYNTTFLDKLKMDLLYIEKYSLLLDLRLILMTIKVIFMKDSTEGV